MTTRTLGAVASTLSLLLFPLILAGCNTPADSPEVTLYVQRRVDAEEFVTLTDEDLVRPNLARLSAAIGDAAIDGFGEAALSAAERDDIEAFLSSRWIARYGSDRLGEKDIEYGNAKYRVIYLQAH